MNSDSNKDIGMDLLRSLHGPVKPSGTSENSEIGLTHTSERIAVQNDLEPFPFTFDTGWGGKVIINGKSNSRRTPGDWTGMENLTYTEGPRPFRTDSSFTDAEDILNTLALQTLQDKPKKGETLPVTFMTYSGDGARDTLIRPTAIIATPEKMLHQGRISEAAHSITHLNYNTKQGGGYSKLIGFDVFSPIRKPILMAFPSATSEQKTRYDDYFTLKNFDHEGNKSVHWNQEYKMPRTWGLWARPDVDKYLPILSALTAYGPSNLKDNFIMIMGGFGNNPKDYQLMQTKLDFIRAFHELTGKWWHFATNPIVRADQTHLGLLFVDENFTNRGGNYRLSNNKHKSIFSNEIDTYFKQGNSKASKILNRLRGFHGSEMATFSDPREGLLKLSSQIQEIIN